MKVLVACECSQAVCNEFRKLGVTAFSCDLEKEYGGHAEWHIQTDVLSILHGDCKFVTNDGKRHYIDKWDLVIAHPPCTFLSRAQNGLYNENRFPHEYIEKRKQNRQKAVSFFMEFVNLDCPYLIENPIGYMNTHYRKPDQCIEPYMFGDPATKTTCLWLNKLPKFQPTHYVDKPGVHTFPNSNPMGLWYFETSKLPHKERARARSKTFPGIAKAIAYQYTNYLKWFS